MSKEVAIETLQEAARALLVRPLLSSGGPDAAIAAIVRRPLYRDRLQQWFEHNLGWNLVVDRDVIRLHKIPAGTPCLPHDAPEQRVCVLYCLVLAALEDGGDQVVITEIADAVGVLSGTRTEIPTFDPADFAERRRLVQSLRLLVDHGVLVPTRDRASTEQDEVEYVSGSGNAIYDVDHHVAALLLACPVAPTRAGTPAGLTAEPHPDTPAGHNRRRRHVIMRRLVDEPLVYLDELTEGEREYLRSQRHALLHEVKELLGVQVEVRAEGAAIVDDELTDLRFPAERTREFAALLLAGALTAEPGVDGGVVVGGGRLRELAEWVTEQVATRVKSIGNKPVTSANVLEEALKVLSALRLVRREADGVELLPALGRFRSSASDPSSFGNVAGRPSRANDVPA